MIGFKQYLNEVLATDWGMKNKQDSVLPNMGKKFRDDLEYAQKTASLGYEKLFKFGNYVVYYKNKDECVFCVYDNKLKAFTLYLSGYSGIKEVVKIYTLGSTNDNRLKAHDFYHELIKRGYTLHAKIQSEGVQPIWSKLSKFRDVNIQGLYNGKPVNVSFAKNSDEIYLDHDSGETYSDGRKRSVYGITLIAHEK